MGVVPPFDKIQINAVMQKNSKIINFNPLLKRETNVYAHSSRILHRTKLVRWNGKKAQNLTAVKAFGVT